MKKIDCWHFVGEDKRLRYGCGLEVEAGYTYTEDGPISICERGLHGSRSAYNALKYATGPVLCRVRIWGDVSEHEDKLVGRHREVLDVRDVSAELRLWGCWCIRNTSIGNGRTVWDLLADERSRKAVEIAEAFAVGKATKEQLPAARAAAWAAAGAAAGAAAMDAARAAARYAAMDAARAAAMAAAWSAAGAAAMDAARYAAMDAAMDAAAKFQADELERRMRELFGIKKRKVA